MIKVSELIAQKGLAYLQDAYTKEELEAIIDWICFRDEGEEKPYSISKKDLNRISHYLLKISLKYIRKVDVHCLRNRDSRDYT